MKKAVIFNLGCKVNQYECDVLASSLKTMGYATSEKLEYADLYIVNTCAVTAEAERKSRQVLARIRAHNPDAYIAICGCASQKNADFFRHNGVQYVSGASGKNKLITHLQQDLDLAKNSFKATDLLPSGNRTRVYVKIQDGCANFCTYCIIPHLRGQPQSKSVAEAAAEITKLAATTQEIVLTGINLSYYGQDTNESLTQLIQAIRDVDVRIRLGSFYVEGINSELLDALFSLKDFCPHFHLSLQNGDDGVLRDMNRHYTTQDYRSKVDMIRTYNPLAAIATDIIVGFPTETEEAFCNTLDFVNQVGFADIHIFPFSAREGTPAATLTPLPPPVIKQRVARLTAAKAALRTAYLTKMLAIPQDVIFEDGTQTQQSGYSQYYIRCYRDLNVNQKRAIIYPIQLYKDGLK